MSDEHTPAETDQTEFDRLYRHGTALLHQGEAVKATPWLEKAHALNPGHLDAAINLSGAYILAGKFKWAVPLLEELSRRAPDNAMVWTNLGAAYLGNPILATEEQQLAAIAAFRRALDADPIAPNVAYNLGLIYRDRRETEAARHWFQQAIKANPQDRDARRNLERLAIS
jgi:tetratricopeptide (TPR) repeat protein